MVVLAINVTTRRFDWQPNLWAARMVFLSLVVARGRLVRLPSRRRRQACRDRSPAVLPWKTAGDGWPARADRWRNRASPV